MWAELCNLTFQNDYKLKQECEKFGKLLDLNEDDRRNSIDFFLRNFRLIFANKENYNDNQKEFIHEEEKVLFEEI